MTLAINEQPQAEAEKKTWLTPELELISSDKVLSANIFPHSETAAGYTQGTFS